MRIRVELTGPLRAAADAGSREVKVPLDATIQAALAQLANELGAAGKSALLDPHGNLASGVLACVNGTQVTDIATTRLKSGDEILLVSAISGG